MTKQAMGELAEQCEVLGLIARAPDPSDGRARIITFTPFGLEWLEEFHAAVNIAEREMRREVGPAAMDTVVAALAAYGTNFGTLDTARNNRVTLSEPRIKVAKTKPKIRA
jgi:DNA-binding MarR family transcriptional regulator